MKSVLPFLAASAFTVLATIAIAQPTTSTYQPPARSAVLGTTFVDWDALVARSTRVGESRAVFDNPTPTLEKFEMHVTTLLPKMQSHPVHQHAWEEMLLIKEGQVEVSINGETHRAGPGWLIFLASHDPHNLTNVGDTPATYYVINFYTDLVHTVADKPAHEQAVPRKLPSSVIDCDSLPSVKNDAGSRISVVSGSTLTFPGFSSHITKLDVGKSTATDMIDSGDELFVLKTGQLEATVNGITCRLNAGSFFYCAPNDKRTFKNIGTTPAAYQVIKVTSARSPRAANAK